MKTVIKKLTQTTSALAPLILRIAFATVLWPHGAQLLLGWFGGYGYTASMQYFTHAAGLSSIIAFLVIFLEFFGSLAIFFGFLTRITAGALVVLFLGMILTVHFPNGFFMNWLGNLKGEGYEFHLLGIGILLALVNSGAGRFSIDSVIHKSSINA